MGDLIFSYMEIHVHSTLALRNQKGKKGEVIYPPNHIYMYIHVYSPDKQTYTGTPGCPALYMYIKACVLFVAKGIADH